MKLYYHKTDGGAEYLMDKYIVCPNGDKEGVFKDSKYIVRIDGDIEKDAELNIETDMFLNYLSKNIEKAQKEMEQLSGEDRAYEAGRSIGLVMAYNKFRSRYDN